MRKAIVQQSAKLEANLSALKIPLYGPRIRHLTQLVDAPLVSLTEKTLTNLNRQIIGEPDPN